MAKPVVAIISGGSRIVTTSAGFVLSSVSVDPDNLNTPWTCRWQGMGIVRSECSTTFTSPVVGVHEFVLTVTKDGRQSNATAIITGLFNFRFSHNNTFFTVVVSQPTLAVSISSTPTRVCDSAQFHLTSATGLCSG